MENKVKYAALDNKIDINKEIQDCANLIINTWEDMTPNTEAKIKSFVTDAFMTVSKCQQHLFGSKLLKERVQALKINRHKLLKKDLMAFLFKDFDGQYQLLNALLSGLNNANRELNLNLSKHHYFTMENELNTLVKKYSSLDIFPAFDTEGLSFKGHSFVDHLNNYSFGDSISYENVMTSLDITDNIFFLARETLKQAMYCFSHNNAVEIVSSIEKQGSTTFSKLVLKKSLSKPAQFLVAISDSKIKEFPSRITTATYNRLLQLSLISGPFISDFETLNESLDKEDIIVDVFA